MRSTFFIASLVACTTALGQWNEDSENDEISRQHELGVDATAFIKQFTNFNGELNFFGFEPLYQFTYRYKTNYGNARVGLGGRYQEREFQNLFIGDSTIRTSMDNFVSARIGWEFTSEISKRWQAYYGVDFKPAFRYFRNDAIDTDFEYVIGQEVKTMIYGVAPLLGFRFRLTERLSLTTEASFSVNFASTERRTYFQPRFDGVLPLEDINEDGLKNVTANFNAPVFVVINFDL